VRDLGFDGLTADQKQGLLEAQWRRLDRGAAGGARASAEGVEDCTGTPGSEIQMASRAPSAPKVLGTSVACASASAIWWAVKGRGVWCEKSRPSRSFPGIVADETP